MPPLDEQEDLIEDPNAKANKEAEEDEGSTYTPPKPKAADDAEPEDHEEQDEGSDEDDDTPEEVEYEGKTYQLPKTLKGALLRNKDYTHGKQEIAKTRSELEAEKAAIAQAKKDHEDSIRTEREFINEVSEIRALDRQLAEYKKVDWITWAAQDHAAAAAAQVVFNELQRQRREKVDAIETKSRTEREKATKAEREAKAAFERDLPLKVKGWNTEKRTALKELATKTYGFKDEDFESISDTRTMQILEDARIGREMRAKLKVVNKEPEPPPVPVKKVAAGAARVSSLPSDKDSDAEWERKEMARMKARGIVRY